jgi:hypothetical protein
MLYLSLLRAAIVEMQAAGMLRYGREGLRMMLRRLLTSPPRPERGVTLLRLID